MSASTQSIELLAQQFSQLQELEQVITDEKLILHQQTSINQLFAQDKAAGFLNQELADIESLLKLCQQKNLVNGQIIAQSQLAVERMKTSLLESHSKTSVTYDNKGKKSGGLSSIGLKA